MNPKIAAILNPKLTRPEFIRKKDIRGLTPDYVMKQFGARAIKSECDKTITILVNRKNQKPGVFIFDKAGKFLSKYLSKIGKKTATYETTYVQNGDVYTKIITNRPKGSTVKTIETKYGETKMPKKGFWGMIGLNSEKVKYRIRILKQNNDKTKGTMDVKKWALRLLKKRGQLNAVSDQKEFKVRILNKTNFEQFPSRLALADNLSNLLKKGFKWFSGNFDAQ